MARLEVQNVTKVFGKVIAVDDLSLIVEDGECVTLLGPSGCGKTTTLNIVAGLEELTSGSVVLDGQHIDDLPPDKRDMAMVFQDYALYPHMTVFQNMAFSLRLKRVPVPIQKKTVARAAELLSIEGLLHRYPRELSGGQRQRVAVGRAIVRAPKLFLFDEPLSNLDERLRIQTRTELKTLFMQVNATAVYVTHDQQEAMSISDRIAVLDRGRLQQLGTPDEIYRRPRNTFVASFVGSPPINVLKGRLVRDDEGMLFQAGPATFAATAGMEAGLRDPEFAGGRDVVLGIRPEHLKLNHQAAGDITLGARVRLVEPLGSSMVVRLKLPDDSQLQSVIAGGEEVFIPGQDVQVAVAPGNVLVFDARSQELIGA